MATTQLELDSRESTAEYSREDSDFQFTWTKTVRPDRLSPERPCIVRLATETQVENPQDDRDTSIPRQQIHSMPLPPEPGTIEHRSDGSVTVVGHRVRLKQVVELSEEHEGKLAEIAKILPTIEKPLLARVLGYIAKYPFEIAKFMQQEREIERRNLSRCTRGVSLSDLRRLTGRTR